MKILRYLIGGLSAALFPLISFAQHSERVIYDDSLQAPVIKIRINGNEYRFLFDTAAGISSISDRVVNAENISYTKSNATFNDGSEQLYMAQVPEFFIGSMSVKNKEMAIVSAENVICKALQVDGVVGANVIMDYTLTIDARTQTITLSNDPPQEITAWTQLKIWNNVPLFSIKIRGNDELYDAPAIFDSGNGTSAMGLPSVEGFEQYVEAGIIKRCEMGYGAIGSMIGGQLNDSKIYRGEVGELQIGGVGFTGIPIITGGIGYLLLPWRISSLGKIVIDYPRKRYCFSVYDGAKVWDYPLCPVMTGSDNGTLKVMTVWGEQLLKQLRPGAIITRIAGQEIGRVAFDTPNIDRLIVAFGAQTATLTVINPGSDPQEFPAEWFMPRR